MTEEKSSLSNLAIQAATSLLTSKVSSLLTDDGVVKNSEDLAEYQSAVARHLLVQIAAVMPLASIGTCHCGHDLRFKGKKNGLHACCTGNPEHCWRIS